MRRRPRSSPAPLRPAALAAALLSSTATTDVPAMQEDCFFEAPAAPKARPQPRGRAPGGAAGPAVRIAGPGPGEPTGAAAEPASMRRVPIECAPRPVREIRVEAPPAGDAVRQAEHAAASPPGGRGPHAGPQPG
jgi:hypothetical protein